MLFQIGSLLVSTLFGFFVFLLLLRFYMQLLRAPFRNPVGEFVTTLTSWMVLPVRRLIRGWWGLDWASLLLAWLAETIMLFLLQSMRGYALGSNPGIALALLLAIAALELARYSIYLLIGVVLLQVVLSWLSPYHLLRGALDALTRPFYRVFRRFIPPLGNIDLSPLLVLLAAQIALILLNGLSGQLGRVF